MEALGHIILTIGTACGTLSLILAVVFDAQQRSEPMDAEYERRGRSTPLQKWGVGLLLAWVACAAIATPMIW